MPPLSMSDDNISLSPCDCLPPPPDFYLSPPPLAPSFGIGDIEFANLLTADPVLRSCPSASTDNLFSGNDNLTPPAWLHDDGEITVTKSRADGNFQHNSTVTVFGAVAGAATLLSLLAAFLVFYYCRRKRTPSSAGLFFCCLHAKKASSLNRQRSNKFNTTSFTDYWRDNGRPCLERYINRNSDDIDSRNILRGLAYRKDLTMNEEDVVIPVGAEWTFRRTRKAGNDLDKVNHPIGNDQPREMAIYDVPHAIPKPPSITIALPGIGHSPSFDLSAPPRLAAATSSSYFPPIHQLHSPSPSYDNHNPVYEEISLRSDSAVDWTKGSHRCGSSQASGGGAGHGDACSTRHRTAAGNYEQCGLGPMCAQCELIDYHPTRENRLNISSECSGHESGYATEGYLSKSHSRVPYCTVCVSDRTGSNDQMAQRVRGQQRSVYERRSVLNNNGCPMDVGSTHLGEKFKMITSPKHQKRYYINGSLAVSLAEGFDISVHDSAYV